MRARLAGVLLFLLLAAPATAGAASWRPLPPAPIRVDAGLTSAWTGREMLVFGRDHVTPLRSVNVAAAYDPAARSWRRLTPPPGPTGSFQGHYSAVWTGEELVVWGPFTNEAFDPRTNRWRALPRPPIGHAGGLVVWTGHELIGWGGGCCGDAFADGAAYKPATNAWRKLAPAPLAGGQEPEGAWTGRELIVFGVRNPDGPALTTAAAYDPATGKWRRIASLPAPRYGAQAVWDGREVLVVGGSSRVGYAYDPRTNRWRTLPPADAGSFALWTGTRLLAAGRAYDPKANRWSRLPAAPLGARFAPTAVWTGRALIVWGGQAPGGKALADGAALTP